VWAACHPTLARNLYQHPDVRHPNMVQTVTPPAVRRAGKGGTVVVTARRPSPWQVVLVAVPVAVQAWVARTQPGWTFHTHLALAGDPDRFAAARQGVARPDAGFALALDSAFALSWAIVVGYLCYVGIRSWAPAYRRESPRWRLVWGVIWLAAPVAALLDLTGNALIWALLGSGQPGRGWLLALCTVSWLALLAYLASGAGLLWCAVGPVLAPVLRPLLRAGFGRLDRLAGVHPPPRESIPAQRPGRGIGICLSGGGIRAASVALGALRALDSPATITGTQPRSLFQRARWLTSVSGGGYTAAGWRVSSYSAPPNAEPRDGSFDAGAPWAQSVARRARFLENPRGGLGFGVLQAVLRSALVLGVVLACAHLAGWLVGWLVGSSGVHPGFTTGVRLVDARLVWPWLVPLLAALLASTAGFFHPSASRARVLCWRTARVLCAAAAVLFLLLVGIPAALRYGPGLVARIVHPGQGADGAGPGAGLLGVLNGLGLVAALVGVARAEVKKHWLRLGGLMLLLAWLGYAGTVANAAARGYHNALTSGWLLATAIGVLVVGDILPAHRLTLGGLYRKRLAGTFTLDPGPAVPLAPVAYGEERRWDAYADQAGPELVICATAHSSTLGSSGVKGYAFTFSPREVTGWYDGTPYRCPVPDYPTGSWWDGFPRGWLVSRAMALSGAAIASAMGRQALGTTNALLAATNLRLGAWVPNPRFVGEFADRARSPRVHLGYLAKEIFGRYRVDNDPFVYVADGGHRENLGLVELLRMKPEVVFSIDASGDPPGSFSTLKQAIEMARLELGVTVTVRWAEVEHPAQGLPDDCVARGDIRYPDGSTGRLYYGRYQPCACCPSALLDYSTTRPPFPYYSTRDQFLSPDEYAKLVDLGEHVGQRLAALYAADEADRAGRSVAVVAR